MFYVEKWNRAKKKELAIIHVGPPIVVLVAFLGITLWSYVDAKNNIKAAQHEILNTKIQETKTLIENRMLAYEDILRAGVGLFSSSNEVTRPEWRNFVGILELEKRYPGIQGVGYSQVILPADITSHQEKYRDQTYPNYTVHPINGRAIYTSIVFLEPKNEANDKAIGFDMSSEAGRKAAMDLARDTGTTTVTDKVVLVQDQGKAETRPGFLMYVPHYNDHTQINSLSERRTNIKGFVYAPFRSDDLLNEVNTQLNQDGFAYRIFDGNPTENNLLYASPKYSEVSSQKSMFASEYSLKISNQLWTIQGLIDTSVVTKSENERPLTILWLGVFFSILLALFIYMLLLNRTRALSSKESSEIQAAKDELLALASHQLRTPATGVKQYLGLLQEGYAGKLNKDQREYVNKAYESNERQLHTINQMLFVARSDAGKIKLTIRLINITALIRDILDEQKNAIKEKSHTLNQRIPKKPLTMYGDEQYLRMALENVVTNAIKYTDAGGTIKVRVTRTGNEIKITVEDNGVGVNQGDLPLLFMKFSRIPNELTSKVSGSGIGLYLTKSVIKAHRGHIEFESVVHSGSLVTITMPSKLPKELGYL